MLPPAIARSGENAASAKGRRSPAPHQSVSVYRYAATPPTWMYNALTGQVPSYHAVTLPPGRHLAGTADYTGVGSRTAKK